MFVFLTILFSLTMMERMHFRVRGYFQAQPGPCFNVTQPILFPEALVAWIVYCLPISHAG